MSYEVVSAVYDRFSGVDVKARSDFLARIFCRQKGGIILDVGCGSGKVTALMADRGFSMIGCDQSPLMLDAAAENAAGKDVLLLCQSAEKLDLYGTVDGAYAVGDVVNHFTDEKRLLKAFKRISLFLVPKGLFVFDVNTEKKFEKTLGQNVFYYEDENDSLLWRCDYDKNTRLCRNDFTLFTKKGEGYIKSVESFCERAYGDPKLRETLSEAGFEVVAVYGGEFKRRAPRADDDRIVYIAKKVR